MKSGIDQYKGEGRSLEFVHAEKREREIGNITDETRERLTEFDTIERLFDVTVSALWGISKYTAHEYSPPPYQITAQTYGEEKLSDRSAEELLEMLDAAQHEADALLEGYGALAKEGKRIGAEIRVMDVSTSQDIQNMNALLFQIKDIAMQMQRQRARVDELYASAPLLEWQYKNKLLKETAGVSTFDELRAKIHEIRAALRPMERTWLRRRLHAEEIQHFTSQEKAMEAVAIRQYGQRAHIERFQYDASRIPEQLMREATGAAIRKLLEWHEERLSALQAVAVESERETLDPAEIDELNEAYITAQVIPFIESEKERYLERERRDMESLLYPDEVLQSNDLGPFSDENVAHALRLLKDAWSVRPHEEGWRDSDEAENERTKDVQGRLEQLPSKLRHVIESFISVSRLFQRNIPRNLLWKEMSHFVAHAREFHEASVCAKNFQRQLDAVSALPAQSFLSTIGKHNKERDIHDAAVVMGTEAFIGSLDPDRWQVLTESSLIQEKIGTEKVAEADAILGNMVRDRLVETNEHTNQSVGLGYRLFAFHTPEVAPFAIMNAYRELGHSGEYPFLSPWGYPRMTALYSYLATITPECLHALEERGVPGMQNIVRLAKENPDTFLLKEIKTPGGKNSSEPSYERNPVYWEVQEAFAKIGVHYLKTGDEDVRFFTLGMLERIDADLGDEGYRVLGEMLRTEQSLRIRKKLLTLATRRILDNRVLGVILDNFDSLDAAQQADIAKKGPELVGSLVRQPLYERRQAAILARALGMDAETFCTTVDFIRRVREITPFALYREEYFQKYVELASDPQVLPFLEKMEKYNFKLQIEYYPVELIREMAAHADDIETGMAEVNAFFPGVSYWVQNEYIWDEAERKSETVWVTDPYEIAAGRLKALELCQGFYAKMEAGDAELGVPRKFSDAVLRTVRTRDLTLRDTGKERGDVSQERYEQFHAALEEFIQAAYDPDGPLHAYADFFVNDYALQFLARQPEKLPEILSIPERAPKLFELLAPGGPLFSNRENIARDIFQNGKAVVRAQEIESIFTRKVPYWEQLYLFTDMRLGTSLAASESKFPVRGALGATWRELAYRHHAQKAEHPDTASDLEAIVADEKIRDAIIQGQVDSVPFASLTGVHKRLVFKEHIRCTVEISRSREEKRKADAHNRMTMQKQLVFQDSFGAHGSRIEFLSDILLSGNLPKESLGEGCDTDSYGFHFDFWKIGPKDGVETVQALRDKTRVNTYSGESHGSTKGMILLYNRADPGAYAFGQEIRVGIAGPLHEVILGGMPSTEISGIVLDEQADTLAQAKRAVIDIGCYIPIYDRDGALVFTPEEFDIAVEERNMQIPVAVWDYSMRTGKQLGSNPGGTYTVGSESGPKNYYVKFTVSEHPDHLWNEQLADEFYRHAGLGVPDTMIVRVAGSYGHASEWLKTDTGDDRSDLKNGFIMDAWLANWDAAANQENTKQVSGKTYRLDNGGSLLFRARGERKDRFDATVIELVSMRDGYPGLTEEDIQRQVQDLETRFRDEDIDRLVDSVRLPRGDRENLKTVLRQRRDYIISAVRFGQERAETLPLPEFASRINAALAREEIDDGEISSLLKEWPRLIGENGYQHNKVLLGQHLKDVVTTVKERPEFGQLPPREQHLALLACLFHDIAKPTGKRSENVERDFGHEVPSANMAAGYMKEWGYGAKDIETVVLTILYDGVVSDIARGKVRDQSKNLSPNELRERLRNDERVVQILRAVNVADVIGTVGDDAFEAIKQRYDAYFDSMLAQTK